MLNINGELLDKLDENEYYLLSILLNYGKKSHPKNDVLLFKTGWGDQKLKRVKRGLKNKGVLVINSRFGGEKGRGRKSNQYIIKTNLATKYNGLKRDDFNTVEIQLDDFNTVEIQLDDFKRGENHPYNKVLKYSIIENIKVLKEKSIKEKNTRLKEFQSENENLKAQILELKILNEKQRKKVALKKESKKMPLGLSSFEQMEYRRKNKTWTQLDTNFNGGFKMPIEWPENLQNEVLGQWIYLDEKKGQNWGTSRTLSAQISLINGWLKKYTAAEIIESLSDCQQRGNVTPNPKWTINRKLKEKQDDEKQRANNGKSIYENYADYLRGDHDPDENDTIDISWASA